MKIPSFQKVSASEMKGWLREDIIPFLPPPFFENPFPFILRSGGRLIGESKWRWAAIITLSNGKKIFLKRDKTKGWAESLRYLLFPSKGRKEWFIAYQMQKRNLPVPDPLGWLERVRRGMVRESYYLSKAIESGVSLTERLDLLRDEKVLSSLAKTVIRVHQSGLDHKDFHAGNFLWDGESFFLTDLHRARILKSLSLKQKLWSLAHLFHSLRSIWEKGDQVKFLKAYFDGDSTHIQEQERYLEKIHSRMIRLQRRQWRSRTNRCLKESTEFSAKREKGIRYCHRREYSLDQIKRVVETHLSLVKEEPSSLAKYSSEVAVSVFYTGTLIPAQDVIHAEAGIQEETGFPRIKDGAGLVKPGMTNGKGLLASRTGGGEKKVCVKQFCYPSSWQRFRKRFRRSKGLKAWVAGNGLIVRGIASLKPFALVERRDWLGLTESFFVMEAPQRAEELDRYLSRGFDTLKEKRLFIKACANWLFHLHQKDLYHQDMKACNILVLKEGPTWDFRLLDLEDLLLDKRVDEKRVFKNLLQLNTSIPQFITRTDRLRFFSEYQRLRPIVEDEQGFLSQLIRRSRERGVVYVSPEGVVEERSGYSSEMK